MPQHTDLLAGLCSGRRQRFPPSQECGWPGWARITPRLGVGVPSLAGRRREEQAVEGKGMLSVGLSEFRRSTGPPVEVHRRTLRSS